MTDELDPTIRRLRSVDVIDPGAYDDAFFEGLADAVMHRIEAGSTESRVLELPRRRAPRWLAPAAALAALLGGALLLSPGPDPLPSASADDALATLGAEIGRDVLAEVTAPEAAPASDRLALSWATDDLLDEAEDDSVYTSWSLFDELDDLSADELRSVFTRL